MLTPEYLNNFMDDYLGMCDVLNEQIVRDVARRIMKAGKITPSAEWQLRQAKQSGALMEDVIREIGMLTEKSDAEIMQMFEDAGLQGMLNDAAPLIQSGRLNRSEIMLSVAMRRIMEAAAEKCKGDISNLTLTTAVTTQQGFMQALNEAYMKVMSGAFSYQEAIKQAIRKAAVKGMMVLYSSGHESKLDVAVRTALLTGVNQTAGKLTEIYSSELGVEYYETTAHAGARPSHTVWQGRVFKIKGTGGGYENFYDATQYGSGAGLCGWNCRHSFYPFWPGISKPAYSENQLKSYGEAKYIYKGDKLTEYECSQIQRSYERKIRESKRILAGLDSGMQHAPDEETKQALKEEFTAESVRLKELEKNMKYFCRQTNRAVDSFRTQVHAVKDKYGNIVNFGKSTSMKAVWAAKKA